jgi:8-amino-7-oxononanoate synthase
MSKALGVGGGFIACARTVRDYLINRAGGFIFSTAPSPLVVGAALRAWELLADMHAERAHVLALAARLRQTLRERGFNPGQGDTQIVPVLLGAPEAALAARDRLERAGVCVSAVRPPTVPKGTSRLRIGLSAAHTDADLDRLLEALGRP